MKLLVIRHAESLRNVIMKGKAFYYEDETKLDLPVFDIPLTDIGIQQAHTLAESLYLQTKEGNLTPPDHVLSSGLLRADTTAEIVLGQLSKLARDTTLKERLLKLQIRYNHLLRERDPGYGFEMTEQESHNHFPYLRDHWKREGRWSATPPGGESLVRVMDRSILFLTTLQNDPRYKDATVYAFSHGGFMMATRMVVQGISIRKTDSIMNPVNCHIDSYTNENGFWEILQ